MSSTYNVAAIAILAPRRRYKLPMPRVAVHVAAITASVTSR